MTFHQCDGEEWHKHETLEAAISGCEEALTIAREDARLDGEWPDWVEHIEVYEAPEDCRWPDEDGKRVVKTFITDRKKAEPGDRCDFYCDYRVGKIEAEELQTEK